MTPLVSVIIGSYNHETFIARTIDSILAQSFQDFEIIITDDCSTDGTVAAIRAIDDPRIQLEVLPGNKGPSVAWNAAVRRTRGEFIAVSGSDDLFLPGRLAKQVDFLRSRPDVGAVFGLMRTIDENDQAGDPNVENVFLTPFRRKLASRHDWLRFFFFEGNCLAHPTAMIRRSLHDAVGLYDARLMSLSDLDLWVRTCRDHEIHVIPEHLMAYRVRSGDRNLSAPRRDTLLRDMFEFFEIMRHYRAMPAEIARQVFAKDIREARIAADGPLSTWFGEIALLGKRPVHQLLGMDALFDTVPADGAGNHKRLIELAGTFDVFGIANARQAPPGRSEKTSPPTGAAVPKAGRNDPCPCGSGKKYKHCHGIAG